MSDVAILGCGPAGLLAALATEQAGHEPRIFSYKRKSQMPGAIFIHEAIPDLTDEEPDAMIKFRKLGTRDGYAQKVYGEATAPCSWDVFPEGERPGWNMSAAYDRLWERFEPAIVDEVLDGEAVAKGKHIWDLVISTVPAQSICIHGHNFESATIWIRTAQASPLDQPMITYNGNPMDGWYRCSDIFGQISWEFGHFVPGSTQGCKPIRTDCDCHSDIVKIGRFGQWKKGVLVHHAYKEAVRALQQL